MLLIFGYQQAIRKYLNAENFPIYGTYICNVQLYVTINHRAELNIELNSMHTQQDFTLPKASRIF